jgi:hypothetical protein
LLEEQRLATKQRIADIISLKLPPPALFCLESIPFVDLPKEKFRSSGDDGPPELRSIDGDGPRELAVGSAEGRFLIARLVSMIRACFATEDW